MQSSLTVGVFGLLGLMSAAAVVFPDQTLFALAGLAGLILAAVAVLVGSTSRPMPAEGSASDAADRAPEEPARLANVVILAIAFRLSVVLAVNLSGLWRSFAPDAGAWEAWGIELSLAWDQFFTGKYDGRVNPHVFTNAVFASILGSSRIATSFFNTLFGITLAFIVRAIARHLYDERTAHRAFLLALFFPSIVLWQSQNLKDVWAQVAAAGGWCWRCSGLPGARLGRRRSCSGASASPWPYGPGPTCR